MGARMAWRFMVIEGPDQGSSFPLVEQGSMIIGSRRKDVTLWLRDLLVSPLHCKIDLEGDQVLVTELEKARKQGTFVNGQKVTQHELHAGDVLHIGNTYLRLEPHGEGSAEPAAVAEHEGPAPLVSIDQMEELVGYHLGRFDLGPLLNKGHLGAVFHAHDQKTDHPVALKILSADFPASELEMQHFVQAMKGTLPLRHPNVVTVQGVGRSGHYCWIAREYVEGESLSQVLQRVDGNRRIDWRRACRLTVHVARALTYAQEHHVTHNNITPSNLLIQSEDGAVKVTDFMLARALEGSKLQQETLEKKLMTELTYLAPEQVIPDAYVDELTDMYNLGTIVYAMLTGHSAFPGNTAEEIIDRIQVGEVSKPSEFNHHFPDEFERVLLRMLAKHQEDRYPRFADLLEAAERVAQGYDVEI